MTRAACIDRAIAALGSGVLLADLARRVAYRSESDTPVLPDDVARYLSQEMTEVLARLGFDVAIFANPQAGGGPFLVARRIEDPAAPTVLSYGHGDVVSGQPARWSSGLDPWRLTVKDGRWYGRGTADNKGQHSINLAALAAAIDTRPGGRLGYNVTLLMETGEEAGSPGLAQFCRAERERLRADVFIASDGPRVHPERPTLFLGSRGMVNFSLRLRARPGAYHSGNWGGALANPASILSHAIASLIGPTGEPLVTGLLPPPITEAVREALADLSFGGGPTDPPLSAGWGAPGLTVGERLVAWNTLEVLALHAGAPDRPVNAIPGEAVAYCQLRFVVGTDWTNAADILREHLDRHGFQQVEVEIGMTGAASRLDIEHPWVRWTADSLTRSTGKPTAILPNLAGSLPNEVFSDTLGLPTLWIPHSYAACGQHGPDEHMLPSIAEEGLALMAGLFWDLGDAANAAPWRVPAAADAT